MLPSEARGEPLPLSWEAPTENVDGSPLTDLTSYNVYRCETATCAPLSRAYTYSEAILDPTATSTVLDWPPGSYHVAMTALDADGNESAFSNEVLKTVAGPPPPPLEQPGPATLAVNGEWLVDPPPGGGDVPSFVGHASNTDPGTTTLTVTHGLSIQEGDRIVAWLNSDENSDGLAPDAAGWTAHVEDGTVPGETMRYGVYSREAGASEPASYSFSHSASERISVHIAVARPAVGSTLELDVLDPGPNKGIGSTDRPALPSITVSDDSIAIAMGGMDTNNKDAEGVDNGYTFLGGEPAQSSVMAYRIFTTGGATGATEFTGGGVNSGNYSAQIVFRDVAGGGGVTLNVANLVQLQIADAVTISQDHQLTASDQTQLQVLDDATLTLASEVQPVDLDQIQLTESVNVSQDHQLSPVDLAHLQILEAVTLSVAGEVTPQSMAQLHLNSGVDITQDHQLSPGDIAQLQLFEAANVTQAAVVDPADLVQLQVAEPVVILVEGVLVPEDIAQLQTAGAVVLGQDHQLNPTDIVQVQIFGGGVVSIPSDFIAPGRSIIVAPRDRALLIAERLRAIKASRA